MIDRDRAEFWRLGQEGATTLCFLSMEPHRVEPIGSESSWGWRDTCPPKLKIQLRATQHLLVVAKKTNDKTYDKTYAEWQRWFCRSCACEVSFVLPELKYDSEQHHVVEVNYIVSPERHQEVPFPDLR